MILQCDCSAGDAYVIQSFSSPPTGAWTIEADIYVPTSTLTAIASEEFGPLWITAYPSAGASDGIFLTGDGTDGSSHPFSFGNRNYWFARSTNEPINGGFATDTWITSVKIVYDGAGTVTWKHGATVLDSYSYTFDELQTINIGGLFANIVSGEVYYFDNIIVRDGGESGTIIFSDDFESGDLSAWDSTSGDVSVVSAPTGGGGGASFTLAADDTTACIPVSGSATADATVTVGEVTSPESVSLSLDTSGLPAGISASISPSTVTTPGTATITWAFDSTSIGTGIIDVFGDDGTNTLDVVAHLDLEICCDNTSCDTIPSDSTQVGSSLIQNVGAHVVTYDGGNGEPADGAGGVELCVHQDSMYAAWSETDDFSVFGPYVAVWDGTAWNVIRDFADGETSQARLESDGTNLYLVYLQAHGTKVINPCPPHDLIVIPDNWVRGWKYSSGTWTNIGDEADDFGQMYLLSSTGFIGNPPVTCITENGAGMSYLQLSATPDEVGACYIALYVDGYTGEGGDAGRHDQSPAWRSFYVRGCDGSSLPITDLTSILDQPGGDCSVGPLNAAPYGFPYRLVGSGTNVTIFSNPGQAVIYDGSDPIVWKVWQPGGWLADLTLDTAFPDTYQATRTFGQSILVSDGTVDGVRYVGAHVDKAGPGGGPSVLLRTSDVAEPETLGDVMSRSQLDYAGDLSGELALVDLVPESADQLWLLYQDAGSLTNQLSAVHCCCGARTFDFQTGLFKIAGVGTGPTKILLFEDALWAGKGQPAPANSGDVLKVDICRHCHVCGADLYIWQRI